MLFVVVMAGFWLGFTYADDVNAWIGGLYA